MMGEILYTYEAAVAEYERKRYHDWLIRQNKLMEIRAEQKAKREYFLRQKAIGAFMLLVTILLTILTTDIICLIFAIPAVAMIITKKMILVNDYYWQHEGDKQWKLRNHETENK